MTTLIHITHRPAWAVLCPLLAAVLILLYRKRPNAREGCVLLGGVGLCALVLSMVPTVLRQGPIQFVGVTLFPGVDFALRVDALGLIFAITSSCLWILVSLYSIGYMRSLEEHAQTRFYFCFAVALSSAIGIAFSANLVTLFIFYEILTLSTYPLVAHEETPKAVSAGHKYLAYLLTGGAFFLVAIIMTYQLVGHTDFDYRGILQPALATTAPLTLQVMFVFFCSALPRRPGCPSTPGCRPPWWPPRR